MGTLTLVPEGLAAPGYRFTFAGPNPGPECEGCPVRRLCFGLDAGRAYEVTGVRAVSHACALHDGGRVRVALVQEVPFATSLETRHLRGTAAVWTPVPCGQPSCANYALCHRVGPQPGARHEIVADEGPLECPAGYTLAKVQLRRMADPPA